MATLRPSWEGAVSIALLLAVFSTADAATINVCKTDVTVSNVAPEGCFTNLQTALNGVESNDVIKLYASSTAYEAELVVGHDLTIEGVGSDQGTAPTWRRADSGASEYTLTANCSAACTVSVSNVQMDVQTGGAFQVLSSPTTGVFSDISVVDSIGTNVGDGGLLKANGGTASITRPTIDGLAAAGTFVDADGGSIVTITDGSFSNLQGENGSLMRVWGSSTLNVVDGSYTDTTIVGSGAFHASDSGVLTMTGVTIERGDASTYGGAIYVQTAGQLTLETTSIRDFTAESGGCLAAVDTDVHIHSNSLLETCTAINDGGLIHIDGGSLLVQTSQLRNGEAGTGAQAIHAIATGTTVTTSNVTIADNDFSTEGPLVVLEEGVALGSFTRGSMAGGRVPTGNGGGLRSAADALLVDQVTFSDNRAEEGGAIEALSDSVTIRDSTFTFNRATFGYGGAVRVGVGAASAVVFTGNTATNNDAATGGGAAQLRSSGTLLVEDNTFSSNTAGTAGGALLIETGDLSLRRNQFCSNVATEDGGAAFVQFQDATSVFGNNVFLRNEARRGGGALFVNHASEISHNTFVDNGDSTQAGLLGGGLSLASGDSGTFDVVGNVVVGTTAGVGLLRRSGFGGVTNVRDHYTFDNIDGHFDGGPTLLGGVVVDVDPLLPAPPTSGCTYDWTPGSGSPLTEAAADGTDIGATGGDTPFLPGGVEVCDGADNDGDNATDEGFPDTDVDGTADCVDTEECDAIDHDGDGDVDEGFPDADNDGVADCNEVVPVEEVCDGDDTDGDGRVDEGFPDTDEDGTADCVDVEECDERDNDGDGRVDEGTLGTWYSDADGDGAFGTAVDACSQPPETGTTQEDCNDDNAEIFPGATETCDEVDQDCDTRIDEGAGTAWYVDDDEDGYTGTEVFSCDRPVGGTEQPTDCDDADGQVHPNADERCNESDDDCDDLVDEDAVDQVTVYVDGDGDGFGAGDGTLACSGTELSGDCDDADPSSHPNATDLPGDEIDQDCSGTVAVSMVGSSSCQTAPGSFGWLGALMLFGVRRKRRC